MTNIQANIDYYDAMAQQTFEEWFGNEALLPSLIELMAKLKDNPKVLDMGCGTGGESKRLAHLGANVIGIDLSKKSIALAKANVPEAIFFEMDILEMKFERSMFDAVIEAGVLFHFSNEEQSIILEKLHFILKEKGIFQSYYPEGNSEGYEHPKVDGIEYARYARRMEKKDWINQVERAGFKIVQEIPFNIGKFKCIQFEKN